MHINHRLSDRVLRGFTGGPDWRTRIVDLANGNENRNADWSMPKYRFTGDYLLLLPQERNEIMAALNVCRGRLHTIRFKDWNDYKIENESLGTGDGGSAPRQLTKSYAFGSEILSRYIILPIASSVIVTANGSPLSVTVDDQTGEITPTTTWPSGQAIVVTYAEFDCKVRFGADHYPFMQDSQLIGRCTVDLLERAQ
jgi:uncharacterized protein (TIGR02217 family)